jgi:hypothetical protein
MLLLSIGTAAADIRYRCWYPNFALNNDSSAACSNLSKSAHPGIGWFSARTLAASAFKSSSKALVCLRAICELEIGLSRI